MTKADVVSEIAAKTGTDKSTVSDVVESFFTVLKDNMGKGTNVYFRGFGSFIVKKRARKVARNIAKNTSLIIEPHYVPAFKPAKTFVENVKKKVKKK
ncbi:MAG: integration host factor subunit beta [Bacteroidetes bacterium]|nr:integration host factor subunit beta [Bacteroidota bacterium]